MARETRKTSLFDQSDGSDHLDNMSSDHNDERWLISYADMMTLLFGLFVMLYAIAMETQGKPEQVFSDLVATPESTEAPSSAKIISQLNKDLEVTKTSLAVKTEQLAKLMDKLTEHSRSLEEAQKEAEKNKEIQADLESQINQLKSEKESLAETSSSAKDLAEKKNKMQSQIAELKAQLAQKTLEIQKQQEQKNQQNVKENAALEAEIAELKKKISEQQLEIQKLMARLEMIIKENLESFMIVVLKWNSEKHDLDLDVTDPNGHLYNFKKRNHPNSQAKFVLDSRSGPGVEMWQTPHLIPGEYKVDFTFYNNYGNGAPADVSGSIITKKGELPIKPFKLNFSKNKTKTFKIKVSPEGIITIN